VTPATGTAIQARKTNSAASILTPANEPEWNLDAGTNVGLARLREELKKRTMENPMATKKQVEANRQNAQKSTGPKTPEGKQIVSANGVTHGQSAARAVVLPDEQEAFDYFSAILRDEWLSFGELEKFYLDRIIDCSWRLRRASRLETSILLALCDKIRLEDAALSSQENNPNATLGRAYLQGTKSLGKVPRRSLCQLRQAGSLEAESFLPFTYEESSHLRDHRPGRFLSRRIPLSQGI
jgi:hypothetical protein